jgi:hypothetical protein
VLDIEFDGWFQCRLATDPDLFTHPRGENGWTFAVAGEPDLDRRIRFQAPVAPRSHTSPIGVAVRRVLVDGVAQPGHALEEATVDLIDGAVFEGRNGQIAPSASEPIVPFTLRCCRGALAVIGHDPMDLANPAEIARRKPLRFEGNSAEVRAATGIPDPAAHRSQRRALLTGDASIETDPIRLAALQQRITELGKAAVRLTSLGFKLSYDFELRGPHMLTDPEGVLGPIAVTRSWRARFWMGGWDADALSGFTRGVIQIPTTP